MTMCEICGRSLDEEDLETPIKLDENVHYVCSSTCAVVLYETASDSSRNNLSERFEHGTYIADSHGISDPLLALAVQKTFDAVDADRNTRTAAFDLAAIPAVETYANGKSPTLVAAAIVYESSIATGSTRTQTDVARAVGQSRQAVSYHCQQLRAALNTDAPATAEDAL